MNQTYIKRHSKIMFEVWNQTSRVVEKGWKWLKQCWHTIALNGVVSLSSIFFSLFIFLFILCVLDFFFYFFSSTHSLFSLFDFHSCMFFIIFFYFCFFTFSPKIFFFPNLLHFHYLFMHPKNPTLYSLFLFFMSRNQLSCLGNGLEKIMLVTYPFLNYCHTH